MSFSVLEDGPRVKITVEYPDHNTGLFKAYLQGLSGRVLMGTLVPELGKLRIVRTFSIDSLRREGVWPLENVDIVLSFPAPMATSDIPNGWSRVENLSLLMGDTVIKQCAVSVKNALVRRDEDGFFVAIPFSGPFALAPLFCLAVVEKMEGRDYTVFSFNQKGIPRMPYKTN